VHVACAGDGVAVHAEPTTGEPPLEVRMTLGATERGSLARLLALRISEQLTAPPPAPPAPPPPPPPPPAAPEERTIQPELPFTRGAVSLSATTRRVGKPAAWLGGIALGYLAPLQRRLAVKASVDLALGSVQTDLAAVTWRELGAAVALLARLDTRHLDAGIGPGFRGAFTWLSARDVDAQHAGRALSAAWAGPLLLAHLGVHGQSPWQALLELEAGYVVMPIRGQLDDERTLLSISGAWLAARAGAAYRF
jgi:hypothetical protein